MLGFLRCFNAYEMRSGEKKIQCSVNSLKLKLELKQVSNDSVNFGKRKFIGIKDNFK